MTTSPVIPLFFAWYSPEAWFKPNGTTTTYDIEEAGRFTAEEISALKKLYPYGKDFSSVSAKPVSDIFQADGTPHNDKVFEIRYDEFVLWGYGNQDEHIASERRVEISLAFEQASDGSKIAFSPPGARGRDTPQEYERCKTWAWRLSPGMGWQLADSVEDAEAAARRYAVQLVRHSQDCTLMLAIRHNRKVINVVENLAL